MTYSETEFERDPTLLKTRLYDKVNPELEGFELHVRKRSNEDAVRMAEEVEFASLAYPARKYASR